MSLIAPLFVFALSLHCLFLGLNVGINMSNLWYRLIYYLNSYISCAPHHFFIFYSVIWPTNTFHWKFSFLVPLITLPNFFPYLKDDNQSFMTWYLFFISTFIVGMRIVMAVKVSMGKISTAHTYVFIYVSFRLVFYC